MCVCVCVFTIVCECVACLYLGTMCISASGGQKRALNPLELELQTIVSCHVGTGNGALVLCKSNKWSQEQNHLFSPRVFSLILKVLSPNILPWGLGLQKLGADANSFMNDSQHSFYYSETKRCSICSTVMAHQIPQRRDVQEYHHYRLQLDAITASSINFIPRH